MKTLYISKIQVVNGVVEIPDDAIIIGHEVRVLPVMKKSPRGASIRRRSLNYVIITSQTPINEEEESQKIPAA